MSTAKLVASINVSKRVVENDWAMCGFVILGEACVTRFRPLKAENCLHFEGAVLTFIDRFQLTNFG